MTVSDDCGWARDLDVCLGVCFCAVCLALTVVFGCVSSGLHSYALYSHGLYSYGPCSYGLYSCDSCVWMRLDMHLDLVQGTCFAVVTAWF